MRSNADGPLGRPGDAPDHTARLGQRLVALESEVARLQTEVAELKAAQAPVAEPRHPNGGVRLPLRAAARDAWSHLVDRRVSQSKPSAAPRLVPAIADEPPPPLRWYWPVACFLVTFLVVVIFIPRILRYSSPPTGDQPFYLMDTISLAYDGDLDVANNYAARQEDFFYQKAPHPPDFEGMSAPYPLPAQIERAPARPQSEWYAAHTPGLAFLLLPAWLIGGWFELWWPATIVFMALVAALVAANVLLLAYAQTGKLWAAVAAWVAIAFSNPVMSYAYLIFTELPTGLLLIYAFRRLNRGWRENEWWRLFLVGCCIAFIPWLAWRGLFVAAPLGVYAIVQWQRAHRGETVATHLRSLFWAALPITVLGLLLAAYNVYLFGTPVPTNRGLIHDRDVFTWPWQGADEATKFLANAAGLLLDRQMGLLPYAPVYVLVLVGIVGMFLAGNRANRHWLVAAAAVGLPYLAVLASYGGWNGVWSPPARYLTTLVPLLAAPLAVSLAILRRSMLYRTIFAALVVWGFVCIGAMLYDPRQFWPAQPVLRWLAESPEAPFKIDLRRLLPSFIPLEEQLLPANTGWMMVTAFALVFLGYQLLVIHRALRPRMIHAVAWAATAFLLSGWWYTVNAEYLKPVSKLVEQARWELSPDFEATRGLAYVDGNLYVASFNNGKVLELDPSSGSRRTFDQASAIGQPGDVKLGLDGTLYVLNNGEAFRGISALGRDGQLVRQIPLEDRSAVAIGLAIRPDGRLLLADMIGGAIREYGQNGGKPSRAFVGTGRGFNNVAGIALDDTGTIYAAESSANRVQQIGPDGQVVRVYQLPCGPLYPAIFGEWVDLSCGNRIVSINRREGRVQRAIQTGNALPLVAPNGIAHGPDGTLYVADRNNLIAYSITR